MNNIQIKDQKYKKSSSEKKILEDFLKLDTEENLFALLQNDCDFFEFRNKVWKLNSLIKKLNQDKVQFQRNLKEKFSYSEIARIFEQCERTVFNNINKK